MSKLAWWIVGRLPRRVILLCYVRVHASAAGGKYSHVHPDGISYSMAYRAWEEAS